MFIVATMTWRNRPALTPQESLQAKWRKEFGRPIAIAQLLLVTAFFFAVGTYGMVQINNPEKLRRNADKVRMSFE